MSKKTKHGIIIPVKIRLPPSKKSLFFLLQMKPFKNDLKNAYFTLKALFVLDI